MIRMKGISWETLFWIFLFLTIITWFSSITGRHSYYRQSMYDDLYRDEYYRNNYDYPYDYTYRSSYSRGFVDKDCSDFATQEKVQEFFESAGAGKPHNLDADNDGKACEWNP